MNIKKVTRSTADAGRVKDPPAPPVENSGGNLSPSFQKHPTSRHQLFFVHPHFSSSFSCFLSSFLISYRLSYTPLLQQKVFCILSFFLLFISLYIFISYTLLYPSKITVLQTVTPFSNLALLFCVHTLLCVLFTSQNAVQMDLCGFCSLAFFCTRVCF